MLKVVCTKVVSTTTEDMVKDGKFLGEFLCTCVVICIYYPCTAMETNMTVSGCWTRDMDTDCSATPTELSTMYVVQYQSWNIGCIQLLYLYRISYCRVNGGVMCAMVRAPFLMSLESPTLDCGSMEDQHVRGTVC